MPEDLTQLVRQAQGTSASATTTGPITPPQVRAAARLMSVFENRPARLPELFKALADAGLEPPQPRMVLGITGAPGSGKSTLTDALVGEFRARHPQRRIGVVAVDPSSPFSGGAVLGDRVRMMRHATDPQVFVRSLATRGHLGGLTLGVKAVVRVMALAACDTVIIETVGVGQSEVEVTKVADHVLVVLAPGQGDSIQMLKAGLMEIGDTFVVNKADRPGADGLQAQLVSALQLTERTEVTSLLVSASDKTGIAELLTHVEAAAEAKRDAWQSARHDRLADEVRAAILEEARTRIDVHLGRNGTFAPKLDRILKGDVTVGDLADELIRRTANGAS